MHYKSIKLEEKVDRKLKVKIGTTAFSIEESAYRALENYLDDIRERLEESSAAETIDDLEMRIADLLSGWLANPDLTVDMYLVRKVQEVIGRPEEFGELKHPGNNKGADGESVRKLTRSSVDRVIGGVCGGIAKFANIDPTLLRVATLLFIIFGGLSLWIYIILWVFVPSESKNR